jgi:hypothetical protein
MAERPTMRHRACEPRNVESLTKTETVQADVATPQDFKRALTSKEAASYLGFAEKTMANWRHLKIGPPNFKFGGRNGPVRYEPDVLTEYRQARRQTPGTRGGSHG